MAGSTTNYGLRYGSLNDLPDGATQTQTLAQDVDTLLLGSKIGTPGGNTGLLTGSLTISAATGWGSLSYSWQQRNGWMMLMLEVSRTGATITASASGNIANTTMVNLTSNRPPVQIQAAAYLVTDGVGGLSVMQTSGAWQLISIQPNGTIDAGDLVRAYFVYPV